MTQEEVMQHMIRLVEEGAGQPLPPEAVSALRDRYFGWILALQDGNETRPIDIWERKAGEDIQRQVREIGKTLVRKAKDKLDGELTQEAYREVEANSTCPHCPPPDSGG